MSFTMMFFCLEDAFTMIVWKIKKIVPQVYLGKKIRYDQIESLFKRKQQKTFKKMTHLLLHQFCITSSCCLVFDVFSNLQIQYNIYILLINAEAILYGVELNVLLRIIYFYQIESTKQLVTVLHDGPLQRQTSDPYFNYFLAIKQVF